MGLGGVLQLAGYRHQYNRASGFIYFVLFDPEELLACWLVFHLISIGVIAFLYVPFRDLEVAHAIRNIHNMQHYSFSGATT